MNEIPDRESSPLAPSNAQSDAPVATSSDVYDGSWESRGFSPASAAVVGMLGIGILYFVAQTALQLAGIAVYEMFATTHLHADSIIDNLAEQLTRYAVPIQISLIVSQFGFMLLPVLLLVKKWHTVHVRQYIRLTRVPLAEISVAVLATVLMIPTGEFIASRIVDLLGVPDELTRIGMQVLTAHSPLEFIVLVCIVAVTPAICEEIFFRGYVQRTLERVIGAKSVLVVGIVFGLFHMQPLGLVTLSIIGMMFGYFYYRSRSLYPSMAGHFTNNLIALYLLYRPPTLFGVDFAKAEQIPATWVVVTLPLGILALALFHRITKRHTSPEVLLTEHHSIVQ